MVDLDCEFCYNSKESASASESHQRLFAGFDKVSFSIDISRPKNLVGAETILARELSIATESGPAGVSNRGNRCSGDVKS